MGKADFCWDSTHKYHFRIDGAPIIQVTDNEAMAILGAARANLPGWLVFQILQEVLNKHDDNYMHEIGNVERLEHGN